RKGREKPGQNLYRDRNCPCTGYSRVYPLQAKRSQKSSSMKLAETIVNNQRSGFLKKNDQLIRMKLKELVFDYTDEIVEVLHKTGIPASAVLPANVILTIVVKHLGKNAELREVIGKMLLELD